jgi:hypothetical protein
MTVPRDSDMGVLRGVVAPLRAWIGVTGMVDRSKPPQMLANLRTDLTNRQDARELQVF